jgi:hypothetical protein
MAFKEATTVEERARDLQDRVSNIMIVIVNNVTSVDGEINESNINKVAKEMESDIMDLKE